MATTKIEQPYRFPPDDTLDFEFDWALLMPLAGATVTVEAGPGLTKVGNDTVSGDVVKATVKLGAVSPGYRTFIRCRAEYSPSRIMSRVIEIVAAQRND